MKIDNQIKTTITQRARDSRVAAATDAPARGGKPAGVSDDVHLTRTAGNMQRMEDELAGIEASDAGKVEAMRQAIADGSFKVDEEAVADGLIRETVDMLRVRS